VNYLDQYVIHFRGLKEGEHRYVFMLDDRFFSEFPGSEIHRSAIRADVTLDKSATFLILMFRLRGMVCMPCDRCLDDFELPISNDTTVYVKFGNGVKADAEDVIFLQPDDHEIAISQMLFEFAHLALPLKRIHPENKKGKSLCNKEMLAKLAKFSAGHSGKGNGIREIDPRWDELKKIQGNNH